MSNGEIWTLPLYDKLQFVDLVRGIREAPGLQIPNRSSNKLKFVGLSPLLRAGFCKVVKIETFSKSYRLRLF